MKEDLEHIIQHYGIRNQLRKFNEECFEFIEAVIDADNNTIIGISRKPSKLAIDYVIEEMADVRVLLEQIQHYYEISEQDVLNMMKFKINRQLERITNELQRNS